MNRRVTQLDCAAIGSANRLKLGLFGADGSRQIWATPPSTNSSIPVT